MAELIGGIGTSHVPAVGAAIDNGKMGEPYWQPLHNGFGPAREWMAKAKPDVCIIVYNDHASAFSPASIPTFALGIGDEFPPADEGFGPRQVPMVKGHPEFAWHLAESLILDEFDLTLMHELPVDHGLTVPLSITCGQPQEWPCQVIPLCVNVIQYPQPTGRRCFKLGQALRRAIDSFPGDLRVAVFGTGGLSHQLQGERAGVLNADFDRRFLDALVADPEPLTSITHTEYMREAGSEGIEAIMWLIMRGAMDRNVKQIHRFYHIPCSNTAYGLLVLENDGDSIP
jgi:protocatechuate 4,5-dioxygenase beta chain